MDTRRILVANQYSKLHFSLIEILNFLDITSKNKENVLKFEHDLLLFGYLLGKSSSCHFKNITMEDFLKYIWDKILYLNHLFSKKIINFRQKLSLSQILIESQVDRINANLDKELNYFNGNIPLRVLFFLNLNCPSSNLFF